MTEPVDPTTSIQEIRKCFVKMLKDLETVSTALNTTAPDIMIWQDEYGPDFEVQLTGKLVFGNDPASTMNHYECVVFSRDVLIDYFDSQMGIKMHSFQVEEGYRGITITLRGVMKKPKTEEN